MGVTPCDMECMRIGLTRANVNGWSVCEEELVTPDELKERCVEECVKLVNERTYGRWQNRWNECVNGSMTREYIKDVRFVEWTAWFDPSVYVCFLMTGHGSLNAFWCETHLVEDARCMCGV